MEETLKMDSELIGESGVEPAIPDTRTVHQDLGRCKRSTSLLEMNENAELVSRRALLQLQIHSQKKLAYNKVSNGQESVQNMK